MRRVRFIEWRARAPLGVPGRAIGLTGALALCLVLAACFAAGGVSGPAPGRPTAVPYAAGARLVTGPSTAYVVHPGAGAVQEVDPTSLADVGTAIHLTAPLGPAVLDPRNTLWVAVPALGQVVPVTDGHAGGPVDVGAAHDMLLLTIAGGTLVVTDSTSATLAAVDDTGVARRVTLPGVAAGTDLLVPATTTGAAVPVLVKSSHDVVVVNTADGSSSQPLQLKATGVLLAPQLLGDRVYVPDQTTGSVIVYDMRLGRLLRRLPVTNRRGPLEAILSGEQLLIVDQGSAAAVVVNTDGTTLPLGAALPSPTPTPPRTPRPTPTRRT